MSAPSSNDGARVLVVDDNLANRDLLARRLQREGHQTAMAENGRVALAMLQADPFDLVLLDIMMPEMNGFELLERLKSDPGLRHVPVILISALDDTDSIAKGIAMGADDHLPKPFNKHILHARVGASLARKRLHDREQLLARAMQRELDIARDIQAGFLPATLPTAAGWDLAAWFEPARRVGGDFYDAFPLAGGRRIALVVADVCDKGVGAALFMALFRSLLRVLAERTLDDEGDAASGVRDLIGAVNDYIATKHADASMFATLFFALVDVADGSVVYVNGGHEPPVLAGPDGVRARLLPTGPAVGMLPGVAFAAARETLVAGESLVMFTDGVTDAHDADGNMLGEQSLLDLLAAPRGAAQDTLQRVRRLVGEHVGEVPPFDDITLLVAHRHPRV